MRVSSYFSSYVISSVIIESCQHRVRRQFHPMTVQVSRKKSVRVQFHVGGILGLNSPSASSRTSFGADSAAVATQTTSTVARCSSLSHDTCTTNTGDRFITVSSQTSSSAVSATMFADGSTQSSTLTWQQCKCIEAGPQRTRIRLKVSCIHGHGDSQHVHKSSVYKCLKCRLKHSVVTRNVRQQLKSNRLHACTSEYMWFVTGNGCDIIKLWVAMVCLKLELILNTVVKYPIRIIGCLAPTFSKMCN